MTLDFSVIIDNLPYLLWRRAAQGQPGGVLLTVLMAVGAGALAFIGGLLMAGLAWRFPGWPRRLIIIWAEFIRGIPLIFVIFWLFFLLPMLFGSAIPGPMTVVLALAWFSSAAVMHATLAGLQALPPGQTEAGVVSGLSEWQILRWLLLPQAMRNVLPSYIGLMVSLLKDTSLAFIVNVPELTTVAGQVNNREQIYPAEIFIFTGVVYYLFCASLSQLTTRLGKAKAAA
ncbi:amino acid ABC transporter permease [Biostraticola tofi]|uniref:Amino acid ABC transporter membrane protein 2 (PAAT family) n=1 Tax=Biostraticola tofi TaxID=466109 RepID=A0A4R3YRN0_9GAMM|nr:amino acid ABC transporter permease [Biostraticola tofi]TCV94318.1 amino acid ABC transporter membrane protein 2 (PAAT family) [Biostraticola tofi]